ncbi:MAG TPA: hypothetical protein GX705_05505 [Clostridiales bacterium]|nr:hypothetical protein [Clostridiales bacterium]
MHREQTKNLDSKRFYNKRRFRSYEKMEKAFNRYANRYNNVARKIFNFKTPNEIVNEFNFEHVA